MVAIPGKRITHTGDRLHDRIYNLCIIIEALTRGIDHLLGRHNKFKPGDGFAARCTSLRLIVRLPVYGPLESALYNRYPDSIETRIEEPTFEPGPPVDRPGFQPSGAFTTDGLNRLFFHLMAPIYVEFYEAYRPFVVSKCGRDLRNWPPLWRFARVVRDAIAHHGGKFRQDRKNAPAEWRGLKYSAADDGKMIIGCDMTIADILILIFDLSDDLDERGCPA
jgi:hypothetical protein